jgi:hemolysin activation/secretion protein
MPACGQSAPVPAERAPDRFPIYAIDVLGVTKLGAGEVEKMVYRYTGPDRSGTDVEEARKAIQDAYAAKGYEAVVVEIPTQPTELFQQGIVQIKVSEAPVGRVRVVDARYHSEKGILEQIPSLQEGAPLDMKRLQSDLNNANRYPDRIVEPSFKAGLEPGTVDVDLKVKDSFPVHASFDLNNDNSPSTTPLRLSGSARYSDLWHAGHTASVSFVLAPRNRQESSVISASYTAPLIGSPWTLLLYGYKSNSNIAALGGTNVLGNGYQIGGRAIYRLPGAGLSHSISFGPDFKDFKQDVFVGGLKAGAAPIRYIPLVVDYNMAGGDGDRESFDASIGATFGLRTIRKVRLDCASTSFGQFCNPVDQFQDKAIDSIENFVHLNASFTYQLATKSDIVAKFSWQGQLSDVHLVANEQFGIGGLSSVRGYFQSEAVADSGLASSFELQSPSFASLFGSYVDELRLFGFVDNGYTVLVGRKPLGQQNEFRLLSAGGGARIRLFDRVSGEVIVGVPLVAGPVSQRGDPRVTFQIKSEF